MSGRIQESGSLEEVSGEPSSDRPSHLSGAGSRNRTEAVCIILAASFPFLPHGIAASLPVCRTAEKAYRASEPACPPAGPAYLPDRLACGWLASARLPRSHSPNSAAPAVLLGRGCGEAQKWRSVARGRAGGVDGAWPGNGKVSRRSGKHSREPGTLEALEPRGLRGGSRGEVGGCGLQGVGRTSVSKAFAVCHEQQ
jgi:hypothetical protein